MLVINPAHDAEFESYVKSLVPEAGRPDLLEQALRARYPEVVVRPRELSSEPVTIWYVYRDGRWRR